MAPGTSRIVFRAWEPWCVPSAPLRPLGTTILPSPRVSPRLLVLGSAPSLLPRRQWESLAHCLQLRAHPRVDLGAQGGSARLWYLGKDGDEKESRCAHHEVPAPNEESWLVPHAALPRCGQLELVACGVSKDRLCSRLPRGTTRLKRRGLSRFQSK